MPRGGAVYAELIALATRQAYCGIEITVGRHDNGSIDGSDLMILFKVGPYKPIIESVSELIIDRN